MVNFEVANPGYFQDINNISRRRSRPQAADIDDSITRKHFRVSIKKDLDDFTLCEEVQRIDVR